MKTAESTTGRHTNTNTYKQSETNKERTNTMKNGTETVKQVEKKTCKYESCTKRQQITTLTDADANAQCESTGMKTTHRHSPMDANQQFKIIRDRNENCELS